jgi:hypothetical protein
MILRRIIEHVKDQNWTAIVLDFLIVVSGVYIGIYLGNVRDAQKYAGETRQSLQALEAEMRSDLVRLDEIIAWQTSKTQAQHRLANLLGAENFDNEEAGRLIEVTLGGNDTFYPSRSAYQAMKTGGYLAALPDAELNVTLTRLYERDYTRQDLNGEYYDRIIFDVSAEIISPCWDRIGSKFLPCGEDSAAVLRNGIMMVRDQGDFYLNLLSGTIRPEMVQTLAMIDEFQEMSAP